MDSKVMPSNYANSAEVKYGAHYVELLSDKVSYDSPKGKFSLSYITPNLDSSNEYTRTTPQGSTSNVINANSSNLGITRITASNYIEANIPLHLFYIESVSIEDEKAVVKRKEYTKGQKFIATNIGGSLKKIYILGVANE